MKILVVMLAIFALSCNQDDERVPNTGGDKVGGAGGSVGGDGGQGGVGGAGGSSVSDLCENRVGTFKTVYTEFGEGCGPFEEEVITLESQPTEPDEGCTGTIEYTPNNCVQTYDVTCSDGFYFERFVGETVWNTESTEAVGTVDVRVTDVDGFEYCNGTYGYVTTKK
jgi:hypothetical protein